MERLIFMLFLNDIPNGFFNTTPKEITKIIKGPTIIHLKGKNKKPLFISILLHGNEFSSLIILQKILKKYHEKVLPKSLILFIANPQACAQGVRQLEGQLDFNRIWNGGSSPQHSVAEQVLQYVKDQKIHIAVDIHNNSGENPLYSCINKKKKTFIKLAQIFSKDIVYFTEPDSVLSIAFSDICPTVVLECGLPGNKKGINAGIQFIETILNEDTDWRNDEVKIPHIYSTYARLYIEPDSKISFHQKPVLNNDHFCLTDQFDKFNFKELQTHTILGKIKDPKRIKLINKTGENIFDHLFSIIDNNWIVKNPSIPSMFTKDTKIAKSDCLGYVMKKIPIDSFFGG